MKNMSYKRAQGRSTQNTAKGTRFEEAVPPIYTGPQPQPPEGIEPPIYTGPLPKPPGTRPPSTRPPASKPPAYYIPPYGQLPQLNLNLQSGQSLGVGDCLAPSSTVYAPQIEEYIRQELRIYLSFTAWADRNPSNSRALRQNAEESLLRAKILLRAYSFITDTYYWPTYLQPLVPLTSYNREMRQLYNAVGTLGRSYGAAYRRTTDNCLAQVYLDLAGRTSDHMRRMNRG